MKNTITEMKNTLERNDSCLSDLQTESEGMENDIPCKCK